MLTCHQESLQNAVSAVSRAVAARSTLPVLENFLLSADDGRLQLTATDLEICLTQRLDVSVEQAIETTVPARIFGDLVKQSPSEAITLSLNGDNELHYACASIAASMKVIDAGEFPNVSTANQLDEPIATVPAELFASMIREVAFAAATKETKPALTGVLVVIEDDTLTMVAADGFRLSVRTKQLVAPVKEPIREIVPAQSLQEFRRAHGAQETIQLHMTEQQQLLLHADNLEMVSQLIEAVYPDYKRLIPDTAKTAVTVNTDQLRKAVRRALIFARDSGNTVRFTIDGNADSFRLRGQADEMGANEESLLAAVDGPSVNAALNGRYLTDALVPIEAEQVVISLNSPTSPIVFRPADDDKEWTQVIMPVNG